MYFSKKYSLKKVGIVMILSLALLLSCILIIFRTNQDAEAILSNSANATYIGELLLNSDGERIGSKVFNGNILEKLYSRLSTNNSASFKDVEDAASATPAQTNNELRSGKTANQLRSTNSDGNSTVVTLGGMNWLVTSLTKDRNGDVIVTLWLENTPNSSDYQTTWNAWSQSVNSFSSTYIPTGYSTSYIRSFLLNGYSMTNSQGNVFPTQYSTSGWDALSSFTANPNYKYNLFTNVNYDNNITDFIVKPEQVEYQETEYALSNFSYANFTGAMQNDAYGNPANGVWYNSNGVDAYQATQKDRYSDWKYDYLWLPSLVETGSSGIFDFGGIWDLNNTERANNSGINNFTYLRSGNFDKTLDVLYLLDNGGVEWSPPTVVGAVRPAFHLNLTKVEEAALHYLSIPDQLTSTYNSQEQTIFDADGIANKSWYNASIYGNDSIMQIEYLDSKGTPLTGRNPKDTDTYTVSYTIIDTDNYTWLGGLGNTDNARTSTFVIQQKKIDFPTFIGDSQKPYNGGVGIDGKVEFQVEYRDEYLQYVEITKPSGAQYGNVTFNSTSYKVTAYDVGNYELDVKLKDPVNTKWKTNNNKLEFEVTKAPINLSITDPSQNNALTGAVGDKLTVYIDIDQSTIIHNSNTLDIKITASSQGVPTLAISEVITLDENDRQVPVTIDLSDLMGNKQYTVGVSTESGNYEPKVVSSTTLDVTPAPTRTVLTWNLYSDGLLVRGQYKDADISQSETAVTLPSNLTYNGKRYTFKVSVPTGYRVDPDYGVGGFLVVPSTSSNNNVGINADTYTTKIRLIENASGNKQEYSISWTVDPAKFDLSQVKWQYDGQLPYDKVNGSKAELDPKTLPAGLIPTVINNTGTTVGTSASASVTFALDSAYVGNYIVPDENDNTSYIDPNGDFEWSKTWTIVPATIQSSSWKNESYTDTNGKAFDIPVLRDPNADGGIVEYEYYECDSTGNIINNTPIAVNDIIWSESDAKYYIAKPVLQDVNNYTLDDPSAQSKVFRVGKDLTKVSVSLESASMEYNTNPRHAKVSVANGALPTTAFEFTYYDGYTRLATAPTEVGKYRVEISLKSSYIDKYQIDGDYEFDYEITKAQIAEDWNDNIKPPTLKLKYGQINGVEYEIVDSDDSIVAYSDLVAGKTYRIRAKIKDSQLNNFIFAGDKTETDWHEFSVSANDKLLDPNDPKNPSYPQVDPDLPTNGGDDNNPDSGNVPGSGDEGGSGTLDEILAKLKEIPLWQLIAGVISIILIIIFLSKTAGYESKRKKFNKKADKLESSVYAGAFLGLAMTGWTAIACVLMGLAVVSLVIMLIAKSRCNKAEENYEDCLEEYNRNQKNLDERKREEEARQRDENLRMMFMGMQGMNAGGMGAQPQGGYMGGGYGIGMEDMRGLITETVTALLPSMQQLLPQQASTNDELVQKLLEKSEKNEETMQKMMEKSQKNEEAMQDLIRKLAEQPTERVVGKEVVATTANDEAIKALLEGQRIIMEKLANQSTEPQIVEKVVEVPVEVEKIVEKEVPVEVEKVVEKEVVKEVPVEVEKIVEKEVRVEVPVEKVVEKVVEKEVKVEVTAPVKAPKEKAPRLTLDEAYARLSKQQKKYFDGLREYALTKDKCKEKKSTYFILLGQSSVNPLVKLTIKKDTTVALFKMEDEYLKDIKRDATGEGTKMRVKETELIVADAQAFATAKRMVNLREDQIDRYQEYMKEQRLMKNKK